MTVTAGSTVAAGPVFGNFQDVTISGEVFNDLNGSGGFLPGDPGLPGWTVDLLDVNGNIVATTVTDVNGDYSFADIGPGTYTVEEELQSGWVQTSRRLRAPTRSPRRAVRTRPACSSATSSS